MSWQIQQALGGNLFFGSTAAAGAAIPTTNATAQVFGMWNPPGSGVTAVLDKLILGIATLGTNIVAALNWSVHLNVQAIATGSAITAFTETTIRNALIGRGKAPRVKFTGSAATTTAATQLTPVGITSTTGTPVNASPVMVFEHNGMIMVPEATAIFLVGSAAPGSTYQIGLSWAEVSNAAVSL
jgi:hypothetical protein